MQLNNTIKTLPYASSTSSAQFKVDFRIGKVAVTPGVSSRKSVKANVLPFVFLPFFPVNIFKQNVIFV